MTTKPKGPANITPLEAAARAYGVTIYDLIAAIRNPVIWEKIGGGFGNEQHVQALHTTLTKHFASKSR